MPIYWPIVFAWPVHASSNPNTLDNLWSCSISLASVGKSLLRSFLQALSPSVIFSTLSKWLMHSTAKGQKQGRVLVLHLVLLSCREACRAGFYRRLRRALQNLCDGAFRFSLQIAKFALQFWVYRKMISPNKCMHSQVINVVCWLITPQKPYKGTRLIINMPPKTRWKTCFEKTSGTRRSVIS